MSSPMIRGWHLLAALTLTFATIGCDENTIEPEPEVVGSLTVDASATWAYVDIGETTAQSVVVTDPATSTIWDIAFSATAVKINGGANGPAGILAYCVCKNENATVAELQAMTDATELPDFQGVTKTQVPVATDPLWTNTTFDVKKWYRYNITGSDNHIWPTYDVYLIKRGTEVFKLQVTNYYDAVGTARHISFRFARLTD